MSSKGGGQIKGENDIHKKKHTHTHTYTHTLIRTHTHSVRERDVQNKDKYVQRGRETNRYSEKQIFRGFGCRMSTYINTQMDRKRDKV